MPQTVTHILIPLILCNLFRDIFFKKNKREVFPLHYVLIAGVAGVLPDIDILVYYILCFFGFALNEVHITFSHNILIPLIFFVLALFFMRFKNKELGKHHIKSSGIFFALAFGTFMHIFLDFLIAGWIMPFYPFNTSYFGLNLINFVPEFWRSSILSVIDGGLLILYLIYLELKHKISDFI